MFSTGEWYHKLKLYQQQFFPQQLTTARVCAKNVIAYSPRNLTEKAHICQSAGSIYIQNFPFPWESDPRLLSRHSRNFKFKRNHNFSSYKRLTIKTKESIKMHLFVREYSSSLWGTRPWVLLICIDVTACQKMNRKIVTNLLQILASCSLSLNRSELQSIWKFNE